MRLKVPFRVRFRRRALAFALAASIPAAHAAQAPDYYGTLEPFAKEAVYFVVTDRFVNGDPSNDHRDQGGPDPATRTFDRPTAGSDAGDNVGYLGGDFKGIVDHLDYIRGMGFSALWITPIVDNPDEAFTGGKPAQKGGFLTDGGKTGYHGYWGVNFYKLDEHLPSKGLDFKGLADAVHGQDMKLVLDIVGNHGSPAYSMPKAQPQFGQVFDRDGKLVADHQNLPPAKLDPKHNPLHRFYNTKPGLAELSDFNENEPAVMDYLAGAYAQWIGQGADAFRIDTIGWLPHPFWHEFVARMRREKPGMFMFGEAFEYDAKKIAEHTWAQNANVSVLDFPLKQGLEKAFGHERAGFEVLADRLYLDGGPYANPYELATFYDNHDMARLDATDEGFIDAHNWLFTARGIPVVYYGSEIGFMRGKPEHDGNRNYFGAERIASAASHPIHRNLSRIAHVRAASPALQRGLQVNVELKGDRAAFYRVYQHEDVSQIALVLLNKGDAPAAFDVKQYVQPGAWRAAIAGKDTKARAGGSLKATVPAHGVEVFLLDAPVTHPQLRAELDRLMKVKRPE